jgi:hypothetical protein
LKTKTKTTREINKKLKEVHEDFDRHIKELGVATSGCCTCNNFWGLLKSLNWALGKEDEFS